MIYYQQEFSENQKCPLGGDKTPNNKNHNNIQRAQTSAKRLISQHAEINTCSLLYGGRSDANLHNIVVCFMIKAPLLLTLAYDVHIIKGQNICEMQNIIKTELSTLIILLTSYSLSCDHMKVL